MLAGLKASYTEMLFVKCQTEKGINEYRTVEIHRLGNTVTVNRIIANISP